MYRINQIKLNIFHDEQDLKNKIYKILKVDKSLVSLDTLKILHRSVDARNNKQILFSYNVAIDLDDDIAKKLIDRNIIEKHNEINFDPLVRNSTLNKNHRPIVVGFGPSGIFASYIFALNGIKPIIIERGKNVDDRIKDTEKFFDTMEINEESNVCFGEGGAGAFSDGKLNTNNKDRTGIYRFILETFIKFGADKKIIYENLPHIGTDKLIDIIKKIREEILNLGGEIFYNTKFTYDEYKKYAEDGQPIILAIGNSSRDTFRDLINNGFNIKPKPFAIGYRIAHRKDLVDESLYGIDNSSNKKKILDVLGPATYKLTYDVGNGHSIYSFCMCPGGYIINSSNFRNMLSINGMSYNDRKGLYSNSAIVETINPIDIGVFDDNVDSAIKMIELQERIEKKAFELENGFIPYVMNKKEIFDENEIFKGKARYNDKLMSVFDDIGLNFNINDDINKALNHFNKMIPGFYNEIDLNVIAGVETRTSSPVKLDRDENYMCNVLNFYPCGEGLGHGGGIMSSAVDGVNVALSIINSKKA